MTYLRLTVHGRWREMGLGSTQDIGLKDARAAAARWRTVAAQEIDPIKQRE
ncbi:integrase arm-type DNA-binding domain-containing protein [Pseudotabrizicola sp.]|uniref:integrase arm-type DNA-binding domain-containing protein n=1 Tax=Pseudotabrizicola sp. TaxID=2939647 RepID=UPI00351CF75B